MSQTRWPDQDLVDELRASPLALHVDAFERHLHDWHYAPSTLSHYLSCLTHFARWMDDQQLSAEQLDEAVTARFLSQYLSRRRSPRPRWPIQATLKLLLRLLPAYARRSRLWPAAA